MMLRLITFLSFALFVFACSGGGEAIPEKGKGQINSDEPTFYHQTMVAGPLRMNVDPKLGARIVSFTYEGKEILQLADDENETTWGSTSWGNPTNEWAKANALFDTAAYEFSQTGENRMHFYSPIDPETGLQLIKSIRLAIDERGPLATIRYQIYNRGSEPKTIAASEHTVVPFTGKTLLPLGGTWKPDVAGWAVEDAGNYVLNFDKSNNNNQKFGYDVQREQAKRYTFNAYVNDDKGLALLKSWKLPRTLAPAQSPVAIDLSLETGGVGLTVAGMYKKIAPGSYVDLVVFWQLFPADELPKRIAALR